MVSAESVAKLVLRDFVSSRPAGRRDFAIIARRWWWWRPTLTFSGWLITAGKRSNAWAYPIPALVVDIDANAWELELEDTGRVKDLSKPSRGFVSRRPATFLAVRGIDGADVVCWRNPIQDPSRIGDGSNGLTNLTTPLAELLVQRPDSRA